MIHLTKTWYRPTHLQNMVGFGRTLLIPGFFDMLIPGSVKSMQYIVYVDT